MVAATPQAASGDEALTARIWHALEAVADPELPMLSVLDLGIVRAVRALPDEGATAVAVTITPTYSGCPAISVIGASIESALRDIGVTCRVETQLAPAWTTEWMSDAGRARLAEHGIAPPGPVRVDISSLSRPARRDAVRCPHCGSSATRVISRFGSTACKALHRCDACLEPFDEFKSH